MNSDTGTNVQEAGVDEPDVVKTDGDLLVRIQDATLTTYDVTGEETEELSKIDLDGFEDGEILLSGDTVVALGNDGTRSPRRGYGYYGEPGPDHHPRGERRHQRPGERRRWTTTVDLDTTLVTARQHGSSIRLVTAAGLPELDFVQPTGRRGDDARRARPTSAWCARPRSPTGSRPCRSTAASPSSSPTARTWRSRSATSAWTP